MKDVDPEDKKNAVVSQFSLSEAGDLEWPLVPTFSDTIAVEDDAMFKNNSWQQQMVHTEQLDVQMILFSIDQSDFSLVSSQSTGLPLHPVKQQWITKFPLVIMKGPRPSDRHLVVMNLMQPSNILDL
jgi:hypothetical protein